MKESKKAIISNEVYEAIKDKILRMELKGGEPLVEEDLAREFDVSRTPIRDALKRLEHDGFVTIIPYRGSVVREITEGDIVEIYTIRQALESICVKNAVPIISEANIRQMEDDWKKSIEEFECQDYHKSADAGNQIHHMLICVGGSRRILQIINNLREQTQQLSIMASSLPGRMEKSNKEHKAIINAVKERDAQKASKLMEEHIYSTQQDMLSALRNTRLW